MSKGKVVVLKVLRGRYDDFVPAILRKIRKHFSGKRLAFVVPRRALRWLPFSPDEVEEIVAVEGGGPNPFKALEVMRRLELREIREVVLIYDNRFPLGYLKKRQLLCCWASLKFGPFFGGKGRSRSQDGGFLGGFLWVFSFSVSSCFFPLQQFSSWRLLPVCLILLPSTL